MRRIALINQKGGVGKTTTTVNLGAALALAGKRVVVVDLDPQANLTLFLGVELAPGAPSSYRVLTGEASFGAGLRATSTPNLRLLPTDIHLSGAELELSATEGREKLMRAALEGWVAEHKKAHRGEEPADYVLFDCPPSLGLLSLNALAAADEVFLVVQTQFLALQGMSKLVEVIELVKQRLHPGLKLSGIVPCMYDSRMRLAREVLAELRRYFPAQVFRTPISANVKLAESPSFAKTIFEYAPDSIGARDFASLSHEVLTQEVRARPNRSLRARSSTWVRPCAEPAPRVRSHRPPRSPRSLLRGSARRRSPWRRWRARGLPLLTSRPPGRSRSRPRPSRLELPRPQRATRRPRSSPPQRQRSVRPRPTGLPRRLRRSRSPHPRLRSCRRALRQPPTRHRRWRSLRPRRRRLRRRSTCRPRWSLRLHLP
jgi:chromosome partitioning protein